MIDVRKDREKYIGASDCYKIMRGEWLDLYNEKKGITEPEDLSDVFRVQLGIHTEQFHLDWLANQLGYNLERAEQLIIIDTRHGFPLRVHPDDMVNDLGAVYPVEVKHTNQFANIEKMSATYAPQLHAQMLAMDVDKVLFSFIAGNNDPQPHWLELNQEYADQLIQACKDFWWCIENDIPPDPIQAPAEPAPTITARKPYDMAASKSANQWASAAADYTENQEAAATFTEAQKTLKDLVPDDASRAFGNGVTITVAKNGSKRFS
jgi:hypothetical protein